MKEGDKIVCIDDNQSPEHFTIGKTYTIIELDDYFHDSYELCVYIECNDGICYWENSNKFMTLDEYRLKNIDNILDDDEDE